MEIFNSLIKFHESLIHKTWNLSIATSKNQLQHSSNAMSQALKEIFLTTCTSLHELMYVEFKACCYFNMY